jgi:hypothetical protein
MTIFYRVAIVAFICIPEPVKQKKSFTIEQNIHCVIFQGFNLWFFGIIFILQQCRYLARIRPKSSDSFVFGSTTLRHTAKVLSGFFFSIHVVWQRNAGQTCYTPELIPLFILIHYPVYAGYRYGM